MQLQELTPQRRPRLRSGIPSVVDVEWDYMSGAGATCPTCKQNWRDAPEIFVDEVNGVVMVDGFAFYASDQQQRTVQVLRSAYGRWLPPDELLELSYSDVPDADQPDDVATVAAAVSVLRRRLETTRYYIETKRGQGYRLCKTGTGPKHGTHRSSLYKSPELVEPEPLRKRAVAAPSRKAGARRGPSKRGKKDGRGNPKSDSKKSVVSSGRSKKKSRKN